MTDYPRFKLNNIEKVVFSLRNLYENYGYKRYKVNRFEEYDFYAGCKSFLLSENILTFTDTSGRLMALKPDITLSIVRNIGQSGARAKKVYYNESVYRDASDGNGFREITQTGLECVGEVDLFTVCEVLEMAAKSLETVSGEYILDISHMGVVSGVLESAGVDSADREFLAELIGEKNTSSIAEFCAARGIGEKTADCLCSLALLYGKPEDALSKLEEITDAFPACAGAVNELKSVCGALGTGDFAEHLRLDFSVTCDMKYYSGIIFRGFINGIPRGILSGGRYDGLPRMQGKSQGGIGFAVYADLLEFFIPDEGLADADVFLVYGRDDCPEEVLNRAEQIRRTGMSVLTGMDVPPDGRFGKIVKMTDGGEV